MRPRVRVYDFDANAGFTRVGGEALLTADYVSSSVLPSWSGAFPPRVSVETGDLDGDGVAEIVAAWTVEVTDGSRTTEAYLRVVTADQELSLTARPTLSVLRETGGDGGPFNVVVDDLDVSGRAEILFHRNGLVRVYRAEEDFTLTPLADAQLPPSALTETSHRAMAAADIDAEVSTEFGTEIVVAAGLHTAERTLWTLRFEDDDAGGFRLKPVRSQALPVEPSAPSVALRAVNLDGDGLRLGTPTVTTAGDVLQPVVVLNSPPIHFDTFGREPGSGPCYREQSPGSNVWIRDPDCFDVNKCFNPNRFIPCKAGATYTQNQSAEISTQIRSTWTTSETRTVGGSVTVPIRPFVKATIKASLKKTFGENFEKTAEQGHTIEVTSQTEIRKEDRIYATRSTYDVFEYPVLSDLEDPIGFVVAVVPKASVPTWIRSNSTDAGLNLQLLPDHEPGNLLSYKEIETGAATELSEVDAAAEALFIEGEARDVPPDDPGQAQQGDLWSAKFSEFTSDTSTFGSSQQVSRKLSGTVKGGFKGASASLSASISGTYSSAAVSTHRTTFTQSAAFEVNFGVIDNTILVNGEPRGSPDYLVRPYVYWSHDGAMVLDYAVELTRGGFWDALYGDAPDLTVILPWRHDGAKGLNTTHDQLERTRDIVLNPRNPEPGELVDIIVRVQNYSLSRADSGLFDVRFYLGDPRRGGEEIGEVTAVGPIQSRDDVIVTLEDWLAPDDLGPGDRIYVWLDPTDRLREIHEDNNLAWNAVNSTSSTTTVGAPILRGDSNGDGTVNIADPQYTLNHLFLGGPKHPCEAAADVNGDGAVNIADPQYSLNHQFLGGPPPVDPFPDCGPLSEDEVLSCDRPPAACNAF